MKRSGYRVQGRGIDGCGIGKKASMEEESGNHH